MSLSSLQATLELVDGNFKSSMKGVQDSMKTAGETMKEASNQSKGIGGALKDIGSKAGSAVGTVGKLAATFGLYKVASAGIDMVKESIGGAIKRVDTLNNSARAFENMGFSTSEVDKAMKNLNKSISGLPTPLDSAVSGVQLLASSTEDVGKAEKVFSALNNGILGFGGSTAQVDNAVTQLSQSFSNGKVDASTWNSMINAGLGPTLSALGKTMGKTTGEFKAGLSDGSISVEEFQDALIDLNKNGGGGLKSLEKIARDATGGIGTGISNAKTAVTRGVANIITAMNDSLKNANLGSIGELIGGIGAKFETGLSGIADKVVVVGDYLVSFTEQWDSLKQVLIPVGILLGSLTVAFGAYSIQQSLAAAGTTLWSVVAGIGASATTALGSAMAFLTSPITLVVLAIAALAAGIVYLWNTNEGFRDAVSELWTAITEAFTIALEFIKPLVHDAFETIKTVFETVFPYIQNTVETAWNVISAVFTGAIKVITGLVKIFSAVLSGDFSLLWEGICQVTSAVWGAIVAVLEAFWEGLKKSVGIIFNGLKDTVSGIWDKVKSAASEKWQEVKNKIVEPIEKARDKVKEILEKITGFFSNLKLKFPKIEAPKMPHFSLKGEFSLKNMTVPSIGVDWYATGGIATGPSVVGVGESGDEAILPLSNKGRMKPFAQAVSSMLDIPEGGGSGDGGNQRITIEVPVNLDRREIAKAVAPNIEKEIQAIQEKEARKGGRR